MTSCDIWDLKWAKYRSLANPVMTNVSGGQIVQQNRFIQGRSLLVEVEPIGKCALYFPCAIYVWAVHVFSVLVRSCMTFLSSLSVTNLSIFNHTMPNIEHSQYK